MGRMEGVGTPVIQSDSRAVGKEGENGLASTWQGRGGCGPDFSYDLSLPPTS